MVKYGQIRVYHLISPEFGTNKIARKELYFGSHLIILNFIPFQSKVKNMDVSTMNMFVISNNIQIIQGFVGSAQQAHF